jgi:Flp pilus assembly pilin Flp
MRRDGRFPQLAASLTSIFCCVVVAVMAPPRRIVREERGQGLLEYSLIIVLVSIVAVMALKFFGKNITSLVSSVAGKI